MRGIPPNRPPPGECNAAKAGPPEEQQPSCRRLLVTRGATSPPVGFLGATAVCRFSASPGLAFSHKCAWVMLRTCCSQARAPVSGSEDCTYVRVSYMGNALTLPGQTGTLCPLHVRRHCIGQQAVGCGPRPYLPSRPGLLPTHVVSSPSHTMRKLLTQRCPTVGVSRVARRTGDGVDSYDELPHAA